MDFLMLVMMFILGLCFGSFINMAVYRVAVIYGIEKQKFKVKDKQRSFCDGCGKKLNWYENIPIISWLIQRGKTKCCHKKLSLLYPIVELLMGILFLINFQNLLINNHLDWFSISFSFLLLIVLFFSTVFDFKYMILPDFATIVLIVISFFGLILTKENIIPYFLSALVSVGFLGLLHLLTKGKGMGLGDVKLAFFMGLFLGYPKIIIAFYIAFIIGALIGLILMIFRKAKKKTPIPFGPFLILGFLTAWWWGERIIKVVELIYER